MSECHVRVRHPQSNGPQGGDRMAQHISTAGACGGTSNNYTLDGVANTDVNFNLYVVLPSVDALQEFKVQSGVYPAEFGRAASQVNVSTKPGGNSFTARSTSSCATTSWTPSIMTSSAPAPARVLSSRTSMGSHWAGPVDSEDLQRPQQSCSLWRTTRASGSEPADTAFTHAHRPMRERRFLLCAGIREPAVRPWQPGSSTASHGRLRSPTTRSRRAASTRSRRSCWSSGRRRTCPRRACATITRSASRAYGQETSSPCEWT